MSQKEIVSSLKTMPVSGWEFLVNTDVGVYPVFSTTVKRRIKRKKAVNACITGEAGDGKSYQGTSLCRVWDGRFTIDQVVFTFKQFMELVSPRPRGRDLAMGRAICFDEPTYAMSKRDWYKEINKVLVLTIESFRFKVHPLVIPIISANLLDKTIRAYLLQYLVLMLDRGVGRVYRLRPKTHEEGYYRFHLCDFRYLMFDRQLCSRESCLGCKKLKGCKVFRAQYEKKKQKIQDTRYDSSLTEFSKKESMDLSDAALDRMLLSVKQDIVNAKGIPDSESIQIQLQEQFTVKVGRNRAYRLRKRLMTLYKDLWPYRETLPE